MKIFYKIKYAWDNFRRRIQRFKRGWAYSDVWNMYCWFMTTLKPMLVHLKNNHMGVPMEFENDLDGWTKVLNEMINYLDMMNEDNVYDHFGFGDWNSWREMTSADYVNIYKTMEENKNRFFELFSKYFYDMWD